ncbi:C2H2 type zinc-finger-domain-containing protein [Lasiosphaeria ovina]|uniref:C2H2 type zinc-finger-domain-containing protein n=1 Tax=Lasiosphaeria ovina TaxID=92902 RepID=A0AAE0KI94_9PEZI|nr:C2H2 type zinc-finger-domain-containing protein [Lasiosphaeria ovina]KAK3377169.1 C2H2 type zinc-finger-domain-containing protein [Lasiosphaeria ovina]
MNTSPQTISSALKISSNFCNTCNVSFDTAELRRSHAKSPVHVENVRRRVVGLSPLDPAAAQEVIQKNASIKPDSSSDEADLSSDESAEDDVAEEAGPEFVAEQCLFCNEEAATFDDNMAHMRKAHGLFVPDIGHLAVDLETLIQYLHLIIFSYHECLFCHSQRSTAEAAQHHMLGKRHCIIDITSDDSEYLDFYDFIDGKGDGSGEDGEERESASRTSNVPILQSDDRSTRLPSGRIITNRSTASASQHRQKSSRVDAQQNSAQLTSTPQPEEQKQESKSDSDAAAPSGQLTKSQKRDLALVKGLGALSLSDQAMMSRFSAPEQRSLIAAKKRETATARRAQTRYLRRVEMLGNQTLMKHFTNDVPGPRNG